MDQIQVMGKESHKNIYILDLNHPDFHNSHRNVDIYGREQKEPSQSLMAQMWHGPYQNNMTFPRVSQKFSESEN